MPQAAPDAETRLATFLGEALGVEPVNVQLGTEFTVGLARSTFAVEVTFSTAAGARTERFVVKQDPHDSGASLVPGSTIREYEWYSALWGTAALIPEPVVAERSGDVLGSPFFVMREVEGDTSPLALFGDRYDDAARRRIADQAFAALGAISGLDVATLDATVASAPCPPPVPAWEEQLGCWEEVHEEFAMGAKPMVKAAIRALRANPPDPPAKPCVVHGDFRIGNYLYTPAGVSAILDWEMSHLGDPHEDLGWTLLESWRGADPHRVWGFVPDARAALAIWEEHSGLTVNRHSLDWWTVFNHVKAAGLWLKAGHAAKHRTTTRIAYISIHWHNAPYEEMRIARDIERIWR